ncbi:uncharacterized protein LOC135842623 [Planococcus citri]|uniref:uncharacterized protein LOC135842623 n=1 Tax=Planococcus citri TaxID=170843 RepID=UPI0031FA2536
MKIFLISILNWISFFRHATVDAQNQFEPFILLKSERNSQEISTESIPSLSNENIITLCPPETEDDKRNLDTISTTYPFAKYSLYQKTFDQDQPKHCTEQIKPWLEHNENLCGTSSDHKVYLMGFYHCGSVVHHLKEFRKKKTKQHLIAKFRSFMGLKRPGRDLLKFFFPIYQICIDTSNEKIIWTKHTIRTPAMFADSEEKLQRETGGDIEISTDPFQFQANTFTDLKQKLFDMQDKSDKMVVNFLVPNEHVALRVWRNAVNHYINVAPLWEKLEKLMTAINQGIRKIALKLHSNELKLVIRTGVVNSIGDEQLTQVNDQFQNNIWYKILQVEHNLTGALVVLHNTPNSPPQKKICETEMPCNLKMWYEKKDDDDEDISDEIFDYAYCCNARSHEVEKLFKIKIPYIIPAPLILDDFFKESLEGHGNILNEEKTTQIAKKKITK